MGNNRLKIAFCVSSFILTTHTFANDNLPPCSSIKEGQCLIEGVGGNEKIGKHFYRYNDPKFRLQVTKKADGKCYMEMDVLNKFIRTIDYDYSEPSGVTFSPGGRTPDEQPVSCDQDANTGKKVNGAYSSLHDAHFYTKVVYDMYNDSNYFGDDPWPNLPMVWINVHYLTMDSPLFNPSGLWAGGSLGAWFNDGDKNDFHPAGSSLELIAHELAHAFTDAYSRLGDCSNDTEECAEARQLNEYYSNMASQAAKHYLYPDRDPEIKAMLLWEDMCKSDSRHAKHCLPFQNGVTAVEDMCAENQTNEHHRAFCLIARATRVNHLQPNGVPLAFKLYSVANKNYWQRDTGYKQAASGVCKVAAYDFNDHALRVTVINAFSTVGIKLNNNCEVM